MQDHSSHGFGSSSQPGIARTDAGLHLQETATQRELRACQPGRRGYYTYRAGEGIVFVPYGLSPIAK
jgi:hypothetical protein